MIGRKQELNLQFQQILDGALLVFAFWMAHVVRSSVTLWFDKVPVIPNFNEFRWVLFVLMPFGPIVLEMQGFYNHVLQKDVLKSVLQLGRAGLVLALLIAASAFFFKYEFPSRAVLVIFAVIALLFLIARERLTIASLRRKATSGKYRESVLLAGTPGDLVQLEKSLTAEQMIEMEIVGRVDIEAEPISGLVEALHRHSVARVIFAGGHSHLNRLQEAIAACEVEGVEVWLLADFIKTSIAKPDFDAIGDRPMLVFRTTPDISWALLIKGVIDRVGAFLLLIPCSFVMLAAAIIIRLTSPGPVVFRQVRAGKHGKPFTMYKFRTMVTDAEMRQAELMAFNQMSGPVFKIERDPRITPVGRYLRKWSIDELPQIINVLQGHMSLVGPRPLPIYEVEKFENTAQRRRLSVKPGLTCLWQVSGRNHVTDFHEWVRLDLKYIDNWSIWLDFKILLKTIPAVILGMGAK
ncbi:MAG TPA: sugar transferase [Chthoniobacteraceae bacterium]|jgi:exopolysaccharide biosynthesis polyprenyl glycosylphosphotransferase|nr:sugar transferase [Chthoniobacteraceae bacterium]